MSRSQSFTVRKQNGPLDSGPFQPGFQVVQQARAHGVQPVMSVKLFQNLVRDFGVEGVRVDVNAHGRSPKRCFRMEI